MTAVSLSATPYGASPARRTSPVPGAYAAGILITTRTSYRRRPVHDSTPSSTSSISFRSSELLALLPSSSSLKSSATWSTTIPSTCSSEMTRSQFTSMLTGTQTIAEKKIPVLLTLESRATSRRQSKALTPPSTQSRRPTRESWPGTDLQKKDVLTWMDLPPVIILPTRVNHQEPSTIGLKLSTTALTTASSTTSVAEQ